MYRLMVSSASGKRGTIESKEFYLFSEYEVCSVMTELSGLDLVFTLVEVKESKVESVVAEFKK